MHRAHRLAGYSFLELLIVLLIVSILVTIAYPSYAAQVGKGRRVDAMTALHRIQQAQERWRADHASYTADLASLRLPIDAGAYRLTLADSGPHGYTAVATATWADPACTTLILAVQGGQTTLGATGTASGRQCWNR